MLELISFVMTSKVIPEHWTEEGDEDDEDDNIVKKKGRGNEEEKIAKFTGSRYAQRREELKQQVIKGVMDKVLPDMGAFNMEEIIHGKKQYKRHWIITLLMTLGILNINCIECVMTGANKKLIKNLTRNRKNKKKFDPQMVNARDEHGRTLLILAIQVGGVDMVETLLSFGANPDAADEENMMTPLMHSVVCLSLPATEFLIENKADVNLADKNGVTPLMIACSLLDLSHCKMLIEARLLFLQNKFIVYIIYTILGIFLFFKNLF